MHICGYLSHFAVQQKLTQHCKATRLQFKKKKKRQSCWNSEPRPPDSKAHALPTMLSNGHHTVSPASSWWQPSVSSERMVTLLFLVTVKIQAFSSKPCALCSKPQTRDAPDSGLPGNWISICVEPQSIPNNSFSNFTIKKIYGFILTNAERGKETL